MHPSVHAAPLAIAETWKQTKRPSADKWIKKIQIPYGWNTTQPYRNVVGPRDHTKVDVVRQRHISYVTYIWNLRYDIKELIYEAETDLQT